MYGYDSLTTKSGQTYTQYKLTEKTVPMTELWDLLNLGLAAALLHHYGNLWIKKQLSMAESAMGVGDVFIRIDYPERQELFAHAQVAEEEYSKSKILLLVLAITVRPVDSSESVQHHCATYIGEGSLQKGQATLHEALADAMSWIRGKVGVRRVFYVSDRAPQEFSNATYLECLNSHLKTYGVVAEHIFEEPGHGKGDCDALGGGVKRMLGDFFSDCEYLPTPAECVSWLWSKTKGKPVRGKYSKYAEYRFHELKGNPKFCDVKCDTIKDTKKYFHWKAGTKPGHLLRRKYPCFCPHCMRNSPTLCTNTSFCGNWEEVPVKKLEE